MDRVETAADIIIKLNNYQDEVMLDYELITDICSYFDKVKKEALTAAEKQLLFHIAAQIGIPHYFDTLTNFGQNISLTSFRLNTFSNLIQEASLHTSTAIKLHRYQKRILDKFIHQQLNRYFLSASTSFGKTFLVYEIIRKMDYDNILLVFPTIALMSENLEKIYSSLEYEWIKNKYKIHTISHINPEEFGEKNVFIFTPERYLSYLDFNTNIDFDFVFVDEVYKIDNGYIIDNDMQENERDLAYRLTLFYALISRTVDILLAGPYITFSNITDANYNPSFDLFLESNNIFLLNYNKYEIVNKDYLEVKSKNSYNIENYEFKFESTRKIDRYKNIVDTIIKSGDNTIVYCPTRRTAEDYAKHLIKDQRFQDIDMDNFESFYNHLCSVFSKGRDWVLVHALKKGIGIHHGLVPKYIQKEIIRLFNIGHLKILLSTTTITEGVNTNAKNILILSHKKGNKDLKTFDALNIAGRAGRFLKHYSGNVISLDSDFTRIKNGVGEPIKHINYDENSTKAEIDLFHTETKYLKLEDIERKRTIEFLQEKSTIPLDILNQYKVISKKEKIEMFHHISNCVVVELGEIEKMISYFARNRNITYKGIEVIIRVVLPYVKNENLRWMMTNCPKNSKDPILTVLLYSYFKNGFKGMVEYYSKDRDINKAISDTANFVYNTLKYQVVKYFGAFNLMYKYYISNQKDCPIDQVKGIESILLKLEYNANTEKARIASDYGVPQKIIDYYDSSQVVESQKIKDSFDQYELTLYEKVNLIIN